MISTKLKNYWENVYILFEAARDHPKITITFVLIIALVIGGAYNRIGPWLSCYKTAWYEQNIAFEDFDFKTLTGQCVVRRGERWIPVNRVVDVGGDFDIDVE